jgi:hypothetical protein
VGVADPTTEGLDLVMNRARRGGSSGGHT